MGSVAAWAQRARWHGLTTLAASWMLLASFTLFSPPTSTPPHAHTLTPLERFAFERPLMGTAFRIVVYAPDSLRARRAAEAAFARVDTLNARLSDYLSESELSRLSATSGSGQAAPVSDDLFHVLQQAQAYAEASGGAFDVTVGPLTRLWRWAWRRGQLPPPGELREALRAVGYRYVRLDTVRQMVTLTQPGMRLDVGGIAKGYAADEALATLQEHGLDRALVDAGGDLVAGAPPPDSTGWRVAVRTLLPGDSLGLATVPLAQGALATSGDAYRFIEVDGVRYSHLLDPQTGLGLTHQMEVTVAAPTGLAADALASTLSVLGPESAAAFLEVHAPEAAARLIVRSEDGYEVLEHAETAR